MRTLLFLYGCLLGISIQAQTVKIAAASSLRYILDDIKAVYAEKYPRVTIEVSLGASGALAQQIIHGAPFDFFMAADKKYVQKLIEMGCTTGEIKIYALGTLILWSNTLDVSQGMDILNDKRVNRIALAKPEIAPYGEIAIECLKFYHLYETSKNRLIYADNVLQAAQYAETGNAEVAFIARSLVMADELKNKGTYFVPDPKSYKPVEQACILLKSRSPNAEALNFMNFVLSGECKPIFERYGFIIPSYLNK